MVAILEVSPARDNYEPHCFRRRADSVRGLHCAALNFHQVLVPHARPDRTRLSVNIQTLFTLPTGMTLRSLGAAFCIPLLAFATSPPGWDAELLQILRPGDLETSTSS